MWSWCRMHDILILCMKIMKRTRNLSSVWTESTKWNRNFVELFSNFWIFNFTKFENSIFGSFCECNSSFCFHFHEHTKPDWITSFGDRTVSGEEWYIIFFFSIIINSKIFQHCSLRSRNHLHSCAWNDNVRVSSKYSSVRCSATTLEIDFYFSRSIILQQQ